MPGDWKGWRSALVLFALAVTLAGAALVMGPYTMVVCGEGHRLDRLLQSVREGMGHGHIDGADASYCLVPTTLTWTVVAGLVLTGAALALAAARKWPRPAN